MLELIRALFIESNPVPVKTAMNLMGLPSGTLREPLCEMLDDDLEILQKALKDSDLS
jgi:4-hydroxy-tetrahydrodipicolinate synthase